MSADSFIPLAIAGAFFFAAPIVIAGLAVAGAAAAVSVVAQTAADASRKAAAEQAGGRFRRRADRGLQPAGDGGTPPPLVRAGRGVEVQGELAVRLRGIGQARRCPAFGAGQHILLALLGTFDVRHDRSPVTLGSDSRPASAPGQAPPSLPSV